VPEELAFFSVKNRKEEKETKTTREDEVPPKCQ
jgi:hypothetical protein